MKLFIPFLSAVRAQEGSGGGYDEDMVRIEACGTYFYPAAWNAPFTSMSQYKLGAIFSVFILFSEIIYRHTLWASQAGSARKSL